MSFQKYSNLVFHTPGDVKDMTTWQQTCAICIAVAGACGEGHSVHCIALARQALHVGRSNLYRPDASLSGRDPCLLLHILDHIGRACCCNFAVERLVLGDLGIIYNNYHICEVYVL